MQVAVVMPGMGAGHVAAAAAFSAQIRKLVPGVVVTEYVGEFTLKCHDGVFSRHCDLVVTIGTKCTMLASKVMKERGMNVPLLSIGMHSKLASADLGERYVHMSSVSGFSSSEYIPLDAVFKVCGVARRVVLVYRAVEDNGRIGFVVEDMKEYALKAGVLEVVSVCLAEGPLDVGSLASIIKAKDVVVPVRGGRVVEDIDLLAQICAERGADFFSTANGKIPSTAISGFVADIGHMGAYAAQVFAPVLTDGVIIETIPAVVIADSTQVVINTAVAAERGVSLPMSDFVFSLDEKTQYPVIYRTLYPFVWTTTMEQEVRLFEAITLPGKNRTPGIECLPLAIQGIHDTPEHREWVVEQTMNLIGGPFAVVGGEKMALQLQQEMLTQQKFRSLMIIKSSDDEPGKRAETTVLGWPEERFIQRVTLEVPSAATWIDFLQYVHPGLTRVGLIHSYEPELLPAYMQTRLACLEAECAKRGLTFAHAGRGLDHTFFELACRELIPHVEVIFSMADMLKPRDGLFASFVCHQNNKLYVSSDLSRSDRAGACMGPRYDLIEPQIINTVCEATVGRVPATTRDIMLRAFHIYGWCVNEQWLKLHGLPVPTSTFLQPAFARLEAAFDPDKPFGDAPRIAQVTAEKVAAWTLPAKLAIEPLTREEYMLRQQKLLEQTEAQSAQLPAAKEPTESR